MEEDILYLKKILMENFKSFGKRMEIPFQKGYTNITGPNGSGKSNIADAILFVLGPKSSKEIRAGRLTDLIFNGGKEGKPADYCKVSLVFDNEDQTIPISEEEITFTRRVQKSDNQQGYNSYFYVNGRSSSLTEFQDLLAHARISADGYNLVQQGDISRIVEMSDYERRSILEDIAGISEYDEEIDEAENKKEDVADNLDRINIILDELKAQVDDLKDDRKKAMKYQEISDRVSEAKKMKAWKAKEETRNEIVSVQKDIEDNKDAIENIKEQKKEIKDQLEQLISEIKNIDGELDSTASEKSKELQEKINKLKLEIARAEDKKEDAQYRIEKNKELRKELQKELSDRKEELTDVKKEVKDLKEEKEEVESRLKTLDEDIQKIKDKQSDSDDRISELRKEGIRIKKKIDEKNDSLADKKLELDRKQDKIERLVEDISEIEEEIEELEFERKENKWTLKEMKKDNSELEKKLNKLKEEFHEERKKEKRLRQDKNDLEDRVNRLEREYNQLKAQEEAAKTVKKGYTRAVSSILEARDKGELEGVHGTIAELADVQEKFETALQVAAGGRMQSIVVDDDGVASDAIKHLKQNRAGRATFLPLNKMRKGRPRGKAIRAVKDDNAVDFAIELVDYDQKYENVFWYVFQDTVVMEDIDAARERMGGVRMVTLDGEKIERSGAMVGGTLDKKMMSFSTPDRGKLDRVGKELKQTRENLQKIISELRETENKIQDIQDEIREIQSEVGPNEEVESLEAQIKRTKSKIDKKKEVLENKKNEKEDLSEQVKSLKKSAGYIEGEINKFKEERKELAEKIKEMSPEELNSKLSELQNEEVELDKKTNKLSSEIDKKENRIERLDEDITEIKDQRKKLKEEIEEKGSEIKKSEKKIEEKDNELSGLMSRQTSITDELEDLRRERDSKKEKKLKLEHKIDSLDTKLQAKEQYIITQKNKITSLKETVQDLKEDIDADIDFTHEDIPSMKELKNTIRRGENEMEQLQPVNMRAIDDYKNKKERMDELRKEYTELESRREELDKLIDELDEKKKTGLMSVKKEINENFEEVYNELSDGGEAHLELENPDDPFEGGLIIKARPPGKKVHRIDALSGGEKSLVSMAFIFAIQKYDPSPFY
ncbi:MAG: chromosome segregation protein SMC, partial [Thermoplasmatota archaeon]